MNSIEIEEFANRWIEYTTLSIQLGHNKPELDEMFWVVVDMDRLVDGTPDMAWLLILKILEITDSEEVMAILAAGHLENFLVHHGEEYIKKVEEESRKNPKFKNLLKGVWKNNIKDGVWGRILKSTE